MPALRVLEQAKSRIPPGKSTLVAFAVALERNSSGYPYGDLLRELPSSAADHQFYYCFFKAFMLK